MTKDYPGEIWKTVKFNFEFTNDCRIEVSNFGRIRTFNKIADGNILKGSMINGYKIIRMKFFKARDEKSKKHFNFLQQQVFKLAKKIKLMQENGEPAKDINEAEKLLNTFRGNNSKKFKTDLKERTIYFQPLLHRLIAEYFCRRPSDEHTIVAHLDYDKLNNRSTNLKWMTTTENYAHQQKSPYVIAEKNDRTYRRKENSRATKLTVTKVMLLKKLLNQGKPLRTLVKQFKVTDTQILRIKRGENWGDIKAAT